MRIPALTTAIAPMVWRSQLTKAKKTGSSTKSKRSKSKDRAELLKNEGVMIYDPDASDFEDTDSAYSLWKPLAQQTESDSEEADFLSSL